MEKVYETNSSFHVNSGILENFQNKIFFSVVFLLVSKTFRV